MGHILRKQKEKNIKFFQDYPQSLCSPFEIPHSLPIPQNQAPSLLR